MARPAESEARLSYSGLGDLLDSVTDEVFRALPRPQRRVLEVALLKVDGDGNPPDQRAVSVAVLGVLRLPGMTTPVVVAIDDVQWLDRPSARVLHFALRRLGPTAVGVVVALRVAVDLVEPLDVARGVADDRLWRIDVEPLGVGALRQVLETGLGESFVHRTVVRVHRASGGNPFYALELARALRDRDVDLAPGQLLHVPDGLRAVVGSRLAALPNGARQVVQVVAAMSQPTATLVDAVVGSRARSGVTTAMEAGLVVVDGGRLRLTHPLLGGVLPAHS